MTRPRRRDRFRGTLLASVVLYAAVLVASPGLHHDFRCHLESPRHCQACTANPPAPGAEPVGVPGAELLFDIGRTVAPMPPSRFCVDAARLPGRSPPR